MKNIFHHTLLIILLFNCNSTKLVPNPYASLFNSHAATDGKYYPKFTSWTDSINNITPIHIDFIKRMNLIDGFDEIPVTTSQFNQMKDRLLAVSQSFSPELKILLNQSVRGVYFCEKLGGTGVTGIIYENNHPVGGFIILDASMLNQSANEWITAKENSAFTSVKIKLGIQIESNNNDTPENALRYIFLHEFGHILSIVKKQVPDFRDSKRDFSDYPFFKGAWLDENTTAFASEFKVIKKVKFYTKEKINLDDNWKNIYPVINETPFATLYSTIHPDEFFADLFASYIHTVEDKRPWNLTLMEKNKIIFHSRNKITSDTMRMKIFHKLLMDTSKN